MGGNGTIERPCGDVAGVSTDRKRVHRRQAIYHRDSFRDGGVYKGDEDDRLWYAAGTGCGY